MILKGLPWVRHSWELRLNFCPHSPLLPHGKGGKRGFAGAADEPQHSNDLKHSARASPVQETTRNKVPLPPLHGCPCSLFPAAGAGPGNPWSVRANWQTPASGQISGSPAVGQGSPGAPGMHQCCWHCASCQRQLIGCLGPSCLQQTPVTAVPLRPAGFVTWMRVPRPSKVLGAS